MSSAATILVVDDEAHIVQVVSLKLRNAGYDVLTAVDGEEAFEIARRSLPDLVITDFQMPYMTGLDLCRSLAEYEPTSRIPVLMLTARGYALEDSDIAIGNVRNVIAKPFSPRAVLMQVEEILKEIAKSEQQNPTTPEAQGPSSSEAA
jgi:DNA-binding response OmpR family regulator